MITKASIIKDEGESNIAIINNIIRKYSATIASLTAQHIGSSREQQQKITKKFIQTNLCKQTRQNLIMIEK